MYVIVSFDYTDMKKRPGLQEDTARANAELENRLHEAGVNFRHLYAHRENSIYKYVKTDATLHDLKVKLSESVAESKSGLSLRYIAERVGAYYEKTLHMNVAELFGDA